jgi:ATP-binding protein involved in chromosome partitioning
MVEATSTETDVDAGAASMAEARARLTERLEHVRHKVLVLSGKGGVGKSTVAVNLAVAMAREGHRVGLLDVDLHGPSVPRMLGLKNVQLSGLEPIRFGDRLRVVSIGFLLDDPGQAVIWRGPRKYGMILQLLAEIEWGDLDVLVIDAPPGTGDEPLAACELTVGKLPRPAGSGPRRGAVIVTTPQGVAVDDVRRCITFCREVGMPIHGLVENMSGLVCPECGTRIDVFLDGGGRALAEEQGIPFLGAVPLDPAVVASGEKGVPIAIERGGVDASPTTAAIHLVARAVLERTGVTRAADAPSPGAGA